MRPNGTASRVVIATEAAMLAAVGRPCILSVVETLWLLTVDGVNVSVAAVGTAGDNDGIKLGQVRFCNVEPVYPSPTPGGSS